MASDSVPMAVRNWLKGQYPTLSLKESWLSQAAADAAQSGPSSQHIRSVNASLLKTDLSKLTSSAALPKDVATWKTGKLASGQRAAILVQVVGKLDIGVSAHMQLEVLEARRDARSTLGGAALINQQAHAQADAQAGSSSRAAANGQDDEDGDGDGDDGDHMAAFNAQEEAAGLPSTVFPRSTLQLELSDGFTTVKGFEHKRISALSMADTALGAKLLLRNVDVVKGLLFLTPENTTVKGGAVDELEKDAELRLIDKLRAQLGKEPVNAAAARSRREPSAPVEAEQEDLFEEEEAIMAEMQAEAAATARRNTASRPATTSRSNAAAPVQGQSSTSTSSTRLPPPAPIAALKRPSSSTTQGGSSRQQQRARGNATMVKGEDPDESAGFVIMETNDEENPIVLSDSD